MSKRLYEDTKRLLEAKDAEIARLTSELQLAWNTCEEAETNARRLQAENKQLRAVADAVNESFRDAIEAHKSYRTENQSLLKDIWRWANKTIAALKETTE